LVLFAGPATFGLILNRIPGSHDLLFHRYILAVHVTGILLAGVGGGWLAGVVRNTVRRLAPLKPAPMGVAVLAIGAVVLAPAWIERASYASFSGGLIKTQQARQLVDGGARDRIIAIVNTLRDGRVYSGLPTNWGRNYVVGYVPGYISLLNHDVDAIGFTLRPVRNMLAGVEPYLNEKDVAQLDAFGVRYLMLPVTQTAPAGATKIDSDSGDTLWSLPTTGYVTVVDTVEPITLDRRTAAPLVQFLSSPDLHRGLYPTIAYDGDAAATPTASRFARPRGSPGSATPIQYQPSEGVFRVRVNAARASAVVLKSAYTARWQVLVDGNVADKYVIAPGYPATTVAAGAHVVEFRYIPFSGYPLCFLFGFLALLALHLSPRVRARIRTRRERRSAAWQVGPD
jgi:hypothetical protein